MGVFLAAPVLAADGAKLLEQIDRNLNPETYESYRKIINIEPDGRKREFVYYTVKKVKTRWLVFFSNRQVKKGGLHYVSMRICGSIFPMWESRRELPVSSR